MAGRGTGKMTMANVESSNFRCIKIDHRALASLYRNVLLCTG